MEATTCSSSSDAPSILVIERNAQLRIALKAFLETEGWHITCAANRTEALQRLRGRSNQYDLVLMELLLPEKRYGFEVLRWMQRWENRPPVIIISTCVEPPVIEQSFECGISDYLGKPFFAKKLRERVKVQLQRGPQSTQEL